MNTFDERISSAVKNWWVSLLLGLLYILIAICLMFTPMASYVALSLLFSVAMFVSGTLEILLPCRTGSTFRAGVGIWPAVLST